MINRETWRPMLNMLLSRRYPGPTVASNTSIVIAGDGMPEFIKGWCVVPILWIAQESPEMYAWMVSRILTGDFVLHRRPEV